MVHSAGLKISSSWSFDKDRSPRPQGSEKIPGSENAISSLFSKPSNPIAEAGTEAILPYEEKINCWLDAETKKEEERGEEKQRKLQNWELMINKLLAF